MDEELSESFPIGVGLRQGYVMLPWLFNSLIDGCMREMKAKAGNVGAPLKLNGMGCVVVACLFTDDTVICRLKRKLRVMDELHSA